MAGQLALEAQLLRRIFFAINPFFAVFLEYYDLPNIRSRGTNKYLGLEEFLLLVVDTPSRDHYHPKFFLNL